jgi:hypothetical protein
VAGLTIPFGNKILGHDLGVMEILRNVALEKAACTSL